MASRTTSSEQVINIQQQQEENNEEEKNIMVVPPVDIPVTESYETLESGLKENSFDEMKDR